MHKKLNVQTQSSSDTIYKTLTDNKLNTRRFTYIILVSLYYDFFSKA